MTAQHPVLIGITCDSEHRTDRRGTLVEHYDSPATYAQSVAACGAIPLILPATPGAHKNAGLIMDALSGLLLAGGDFDIPPDYYGESPRPLLGKLQPERSAFERTLLQAAIAQQKPILGICGGMQLINVECGGTLYQDLSERTATGVHSQKQPKSEASHQIEIVPNSLLATVLGVMETGVNSTHHQVIRTIGNGLRINATSPDGVIEGIEHESYPFMLGVQWHPESLADTRHQTIYRAFIARAQRRS